MTAPFRYYLRVRYQECDAQHVVFNARYGEGEFKYKFLHEIPFDEWRRVRRCGPSAHRGTRHPLEIEFG